MSTVAVIGSCVTTDVWKLFDHPRSNLRLFRGTGFASLMSAAAPPVDLEPSGLRGFERAMLHADLAKTAVADLEATPPSVLLFDFIDERFDTIALPGTGSLLTESELLHRSGLLDTAAFAGWRRIARLSDEMTSLWRAGLEKFAARMAAGPLRAVPMVLHRCYWADHYVALDGSTHELPDTIRYFGRLKLSRRAHNRLLARYHAMFLEIFPQALAIDVPAELRVASAAHMWKLAPFHFIDPYYADLRNRLAAAGVRFDPPVTEGSEARKVPPAANLARATRATGQGAL